MEKKEPNKLKKLIKTPIILIFFLVCIFILPNALNLESIAFRSAIVVAIGLDVDEEDLVQIDTVINISATEDSLSENSKIVSAKGKTLGDALTNLYIQLGRPFKIAHTRFVMIGDGFARKNVATMLDSFIRKYKIKNTVQLLYTPDNITEMFNFGIQLKSTTGLKMSEIVCYQQRYSTTMFESNVDSFYKGYLSESKISKLNCVRLTQNPSLGISADSGIASQGSSSSSGQGNQSSSGESSGGGTNKNQSSTNKNISNLGEIAVFNNGVLSTVLSEEISDGVYWVSNSYIPKKLFVEIPKSENIDVSVVNFDVIDKSVKKEAFFYNGVPFYAVDINITIDINEIISELDEQIIQIYNIDDEIIKKEVVRTIRQIVSNTSKLAKNYQLDFLDVINTFFLQSHNKYMNYLKTNSITQLLEKTVMSVNVKTKIV